jgi:hypothetical protein
VTYKTVTVGGECPEHGEWQVHYVVPDHVQAAELMFAPEVCDVFCECYDRDNAELIVSLLNREARH